MPRPKTTDDSPSDEDLWNELEVRAYRLGVKLDGRWSYERCLAKVQKAEADAKAREVQDELMAQAKAAPKPKPKPVPVADGFPKRVAPKVWVDQAGNRYTDSGEAERACDARRRAGR